MGKLTISMAKLPEGNISMEEHHFQWVSHLHINGLLGYMMPTGKHTMIAMIAMWKITRVLSGKSANQLAIFHRKL